MGSDGVGGGGGRTLAGDWYGRSENVRKMLKFIINIKKTKKLYKNVKINNQY
jgi:hypothetical protein